MRRRWNAWGDPNVRFDLPPHAIAYLRDHIGSGAILTDAPFEPLCARVVPSSLPEHPAIDASAATRLLHARGQSFPDWLALRFGRLDPVPDGVAFPQSRDEVRELLAFARACNAQVIPYGGGTSVTGGVTPLDDGRPILTVALARLRGLHDLDVVSRLATLGAGSTGPDLEAQLRTRGFTLGHFPQSFEYSTLGGWIVTRSCGQQSLHYGRIEALLAGAHVETPVGTLALPTFPASAAGIDLRDLLLGSEGRLGIVTEATVRVRPIARDERFYGIFFRDWSEAEGCVRDLVHDDLPLSMLRLSNASETFTTLELARPSAASIALRRYLELRGARAGRCLLVAGVTGSHDDCDRATAALRHVVARRHGLFIGRALGRRWSHARFLGVYLRNALWELGYGVDTVETALDWPRVATAMTAIEAAGQRAFGSEPIHAYSHLSHVYPQGSSVYTTFVFRLVDDYSENLARWQRLKRAASEAIVAHGGTISHQHGVGVDHRPYLAAEKGALGIDAMRALFARFDPDATMNPGKVC